MSGQQVITKNFSFWEFKPKNAKKTWMPTNKYQEELIRNLAENLQIIRSAMPAGNSMSITSGVRSPSDFERLIAAGYQPSSTSDHNCGYAVSLNKGTSKYKKYGPTYNFAIGAADIVPRGGMTVEELFSLAISKTKAGLCHFGQVIYEKNPATGAEWVHFGGDPRPFLAPHLIRFLGRQQFLQSLDGGKSYQVVLA